MVRRIGVLMTILAISLSVGCSGSAPLEGALDASGNAKAGAEAGAEAVAVATPGARATPETTVGTASSVASDGGPAAPSPRPFAADSRAHGGSGFDADTVLAVRYGEHEGYERVVLDLGAGEEPAGVVPRWTLASPEGDGLTRIHLPSASATGVSDGRFGDGLVKGFHVVRAPEGGMFVDVTARRAFRYRTLELADPARLVVDFQPARTLLKRPLPATGGETVLVEPRSGARVSDPLTVSGYSRNFEAANTIVLKDDGGRELARETVTANDWSTTWGYFEATLDLPPFSGKGVLQVGTSGARDGSFEGVEIPVRGG
ncbi:MAG: Gmad2 immunoglobulin-like domain-containing protein [Rubrobacter sp.]